MGGVRVGTFNARRPALPVRTFCPANVRRGPMRLSRLHESLRHLRSRLPPDGARQSLHATPGDGPFYCEFVPREWRVRFVDENIRPVMENELAWADAVLVSGIAYASAGGFSSSRIGRSITQAR